MTKKAQQRVKNRKNFLPTALITIILWIVIGFIFLLVDPLLLKDLIFPNSYFLFLLLIFLATFLIWALILGNSRRGALVALGAALFLFLRIKGLGNIINLLLLSALLITMELYSNQNQVN